MSLNVIYCDPESPYVFRQSEKNKTKQKNPGGGVKILLLHKNALSIIKRKLNFFKLHYSDIMSLSQNHSKAPKGAACHTISVLSLSPIA